MALQIAKRKAVLFSEKVLLRRRFLRGIPTILEQKQAQLVGVMAMPKR